MQFVDVKNDIAFRKIFGNEKKTEIIISFLNAVLDLSKGKLITKVKIENPYQLPEIKGLKESILDVRVTDERDISYIVEMQIESTPSFDKRVQYYTAKRYSSQIKRGDDYPKLNQVIFVGILNFVFFEESKDYISQHRTVNIKTGNQTLDGMEYNFIELEKFDKELEEITTLVDKWIYFLKNSESLEMIPSNVRDKGLKHAYEDAERYTWTEEELLAYDQYYSKQRERQDQMDEATKKARENGLEEGMEKGRKERSIEIAKKMLAKGTDLDMIAEFTGLSIAEIESLVAASSLTL